MSDTNTSTLCEKCSTILSERFFQTTSGDPSDRWGRQTPSQLWSTIVANSTCPLCCLVFYTLSNDLYGRKLDPGDKIFYFRSMYGEVFSSDGYITNRLVASTNYAFLDNVDHKFSRITDCWSNYNSLQAHEHAEGSIMLVPPCSGPNNVEDKTLTHGRKTQASVDCSLIRSWVDLCANTHHNCSPFPFENQTGPSRLIDIKAQQVVHFGSEKDDGPENDITYAALSYVWGRIGQLKLNAETMGTLEKPQGLAHYADDIPKTIKDALTLCHKLEIPYLWVDSLCIHQDPGEEKTQQIEAMATIYNRAYLTIVAAFGNDCKAGLPGVEYGSRPTQRMEPINGLTLAYTPHDFRRVMENSRWTKRGWTYQEGVLSRRLLIFTRKQVYFRCNEATWREDTVLEPCSPTGSEAVRMQVPETEQPFWKKSLPEVFSGENAFEEYCDMIQCYTKRELSNPADALDAFYGLIDVLDALPQAGFSLGLPDQYFGIALCFRLDSVDETISLRPMFPTWCWAAWESESAVEYDDGLIQEASDETSQSALYTFYYYGSFGITPMNEPKDGRQLTKDECRQVLRDLEACNLLEWEKNFAIFFSGMVAWLHISKINDDGSCNVTSEGQGSVLGETYLYSGYRHSEGQDVEFIAVCQCGGGLRLVAINTQDGSSTRVGLNTIEVSWEDWFGLRADYRVVILT